MSDFLLSYTAAQINESIGLRHTHANKEILDKLGKLREYTYAELDALRTGQQLIPGAMYVITNYVTKYRQPYTNKIQTAHGNGTVERLVLTAVSDSAFDVRCFSLEYPSDIIYYDFDDNVCEDGLTPRNGFIQRRIDTRHMIDIPHDWRTMLWARFKATAPRWTPGGFVVRGQFASVGDDLYIVTRYGTPSNATDSDYFQYVCTVNDYIWTPAAVSNGLSYNLSDYAERYTFNADDHPKNNAPVKSPSIFSERVIIQGGAPGELHNNVFLFSTEQKKPRDILAAAGFCDNTFGTDPSGNIYGAGCRNNTFDFGCRNNIFGYACANNTFGTDCCNNILSFECHSNSFNSGCCNNVFDSRCYRNIFACGCESNIFGTGCYGNTFGTGCRDNTFGSNCYINVFGPDCSANIFAAGSAQNSFGVNCGGNLCGANFLQNSFSANCRGNTFAANCRNNTFGSDCTNNRFGDFFQNNTFETYCSFNTFGANCSLNSLYAGCTSNTFGVTVSRVLVKQCQNKDLSSYASLYNKSFTRTIDVDSVNNVQISYRTGTNITYETVI